MIAGSPKPCRPIILLMESFVRPGSRLICAMNDALKPYSWVKVVSFFNSGKVQGLYFTGRENAPFRTPACCNLLRWLLMAARVLPGMSICGSGLPRCTI